MTWRLAGQSCGGCYAIVQHNTPAISSLSTPFSTLWNIAHSYLPHPSFPFMLSFFSLLLFSLVVLDVIRAGHAHETSRRLAPSLRSIVRRQTSQNTTTANSTASGPSVALTSAGIVPLVLASDKQCVLQVHLASRPAHELLLSAGRITPSSLSEISVFVSQSIRPHRTSGLSPRTALPPNASPCQSIL